MACTNIPDIVLSCADTLSTTSLRQAGGGTGQYFFLILGRANGLQMVKMMPLWIRIDAFSMCAMRGISAKTRPQSQTVLALPDSEQEATCHDCNLGRAWPRLSDDIDECFSCTAYQGVPTTLKTLDITEAAIRTTTESMTDTTKAVRNTTKVLRHTIEAMQDSIQTIRKDVEAMKDLIASIRQRDLMTCAPSPTPAPRESLGRRKPSPKQTV